MNEMYSAGVPCNRKTTVGFFSKEDVSPCNFEPRFDRGAVNIPERAAEELARNISDYEIADIVDKFRSETYVCDVCTVCGAMVKRPQNV